ncbi:hypothetical protein YYC_05496 [Plasmodium yoelii 17X]|uniref:Uncharacterized protein n=2 Tax=Plasmodium yoelii TaxID=5861 RepID=Q7R9C4_PLAYO|nr:hypothetical protein [Plasmodium yoelii yoelii]ETB56677.1 hypothetical protein YYC_05496 [Plasmodium yoelii 17X]
MLWVRVDTVVVESTVGTNLIYVPSRMFNHEMKFKMCTPQMGTSINMKGVT